MRTVYLLWASNVPMAELLSSKKIRRTKTAVNVWFLRTKTLFNLNALRETCSHWVGTVASYFVVLHLNTHRKISQRKNVANTQTFSVILFKW